MTTITFRGRKAARLENDALRLTVLQEGGHIAEVFDKRAGVSPLWIPPWPSMEPSDFEKERPQQYGTDSEAKLLAGIMGYNVCLDLFGGPSPEEAAAGLTVHGEASVNPYEISESNGELVTSLTLPLAQLRFSRSIQLHGEHVRIRESVENLTAVDRPLAWTQHVTLGPPFLDPASTLFNASVTRSMTFEIDPGSARYLRPGVEFSWPHAPRIDGGLADLRQMKSTAPASGFTTHLADPRHQRAFFVAYSPQFRLAFGCVWNRGDFPWLGIWEENCSRPAPPWSSKTVTRGMEFGASPFPESRRAMIERNPLMDTPTYRWLPARGLLQIEFWISSAIADTILDALEWPEH